MTSPASALSAASRSPYAIGLGLGALSAFAFVTAKRGLGVTTAFESAAALAERRLAPDVTRVNDYVKASDEVPRIDWETMLVIGMAIGGYAAARLAGERDRGTVPALWKRRFGASPAKRYAGAVLGGALMMFGARMAKGCTSGHALTGTMQLAVSSWIFTPVMFASAVAAAHVLYGKAGR